MECCLEAVRCSSNRHPFRDNRRKTRSISFHINHFRFLVGTVNGSVRLRKIKFLVIQLYITNSGILKQFKIPLHFSQKFRLAQYTLVSKPILQFKLIIVYCRILFS